MIVDPAFASNPVHAAIKILAREKTMADEKALMSKKIGFKVLKLALSSLHAYNNRTHN